jgi:hypothetical protein
MLAYTRPERVKDWQGKPSSVKRLKKGCRERSRVVQAGEALSAAGKLG